VTCGPCTKAFEVREKILEANAIASSEALLERSAPRTQCSSNAVLLEAVRPIL
jgi:hypothetical protein